MIANPLLGHLLRSHFPFDAKRDLSSIEAFAPHNLPPRVHTSLQESTPPNTATMFCGLSWWFWPLFSATVWFGGLLGMIIVWLVEGQPHYSSMEGYQTIAYISDVGASQIKPLFTTICVVMTITLDIAFLSERWLRHKRRLTPNHGMGEKILSGFAIFFALVGTVGLICLSGPFDTVSHPSTHRIFLLVFVAGYLISAILVCAEYQRLGKHYRQHRILRVGFWIKLVFIVIETLLAIAFGVLLFKGNKNIGAILEWLLAFLFTFYILTFLVDLLPAVHTKGRHHPDQHLREAIDANGEGGYGQSAMSSNQYDGERQGAEAGTAYGGTHRGVQMEERAHQQDGPAVGNGMVASEGYTNGSVNTSYDRVGKHGVRY